MATAHILGYPRIGEGRELKLALEGFWRGRISEDGLRETGAGLRAENWAGQSAAGVARVTTGDFSFYDHVLDHAVLLGCLPERFGFEPARLTLSEYFALARGTPGQPAMELTKWFDTNYHYLKPELSARSRFDGGPDWYFDGIREALGTGQRVKAVLLGPVTFLRLSKPAQPDFDRLRLLDPLAEAYGRILDRLKRMGVEWLQIDEPALGLDLETAWLDAFDRAYAKLASSAPGLLLTTYFSSVDEHIDRVTRLPVQGIHLDLARAPDQLAAWQAKLPGDWVLSAGVIDGRNVWRSDLRQQLALLQPLYESLKERLWIASSCSLLHVPISLEAERQLDPEVRAWLSFAAEKLAELRTLGTALAQGEAAVRGELDAAGAALRARRASPRVVNEAVRRRVSALPADADQRASAYAVRRRKQHLRLPLLPTTTIGSFPQTVAVRRTRAAYKRGEIGEVGYWAAMQAEVRDAIARQEALGLDVLVHGEAERNDMVEFFGERLAGFAVTENGWVQSYGSRCVKPPVIYGDVSRPQPLTAGLARYAQSLTGKPVKGMLTGPITILQWSFVRDDEPRERTALQIALAIRDEVEALEQAGIRIIQIDEPALREGLPLKRSRWPEYLAWTVRAFRTAAAAAADKTQIHTHMCYAEFNDILPAIAAMDADVITIETSRSNMELLDGFAGFSYPNEIGPGVYDIHAPRVPSVKEMLALIERACEVIPPARLWVNPDCGLKTRGWAETEGALANMVEAARIMRERLAAGKRDG